MIEKIKFKLNCFKKGILNLIHYFNVIWNDRDWDWKFMIFLQKRKLDSMIHYYSTGKYFKNQDVELRYMKVAKYCIDTITAGIILLPEDKYVNDRNFEKIRKENGLSPVKDGFWEKFKEKNYEYFKEDVYKEKLWYLYNKIIQTKGRNWWD